MKPATLTISLIALGLLSLPALAVEPARPGTVNYIEGAASLDGRALAANQVGSTFLNAGDILATHSGKVEMLLTPGVFLRLDDHSAVKMISPDLTHTQIDVLRGRAAIEVDQLFHENDIVIGDNGVYTELVKLGFYEFNAARPEVMVFDGKAAVQVGDGKYRVVKAHHELPLVALDGDRSLAHLKPANFDVKRSYDELYNWSSLRSEYLAEANNQMAPYYAGGPGFAPGWYWDPFAFDYTFIGMNPFFSPFGWGFYPFGWYGGMGWYGGGYGGYGGWYGGGYGGYPYNHNGVRSINHPVYGPGFNRGKIQTGFAGRTSGGFSGGARSFGGGGFHGGGFGGGGGFHGGGGGFHGGGGGGHAR